MYAADYISFHNSVPDQRPETTECLFEDTFHPSFASICDSNGRRGRALIKVREGRVEGSRRKVTRYQG